MGVIFAIAALPRYSTSDAFHSRTSAPLFGNSSIRSEHLLLRDQEPPRLLHWLACAEDRVLLNRGMQALSSLACDRPSLLFYHSHADSVTCEHNQQHHK